MMTVLDQEPSDLWIDRALRGELDSQESRKFQMMREENHVFEQRVADIESRRASFQSAPLPSWMNTTKVAKEKKLSWFGWSPTQWMSGLSLGATACVALFFGTQMLNVDSGVSPRVESAVGTRTKGGLMKPELQIVYEQDGKVVELSENATASKQHTYKVLAKIPKGKAEKLTLLLVGEDALGGLSIYQKHKDFFEVKAETFEFPDSIIFEPVGGQETLHMVLCADRTAHNEALSEPEIVDWAFQHCEKISREIRFK